MRDTDRREGAHRLVPHASLPALREEVLLVPARDVECLALVAAVADPQPIRLELVPPDARERVAVDEAFPRPADERRPAERLRVDEAEDVGAELGGEVREEVAAEGRFDDLVEGLEDGERGATEELEDGVGLEGGRELVEGADEVGQREEAAERGARPKVVGLQCVATRCRLFDGLVALTVAAGSRDGTRRTLVRAREGRGHARVRGRSGDSERIEHGGLAGATLCDGRSVQRGHVDVGRGATSLGGRRVGARALPRRAGRQLPLVCADSVCLGIVLLHPFEPLTTAVRPCPPRQPALVERPAPLARVGRVRGRDRLAVVGARGRQHREPLAFDPRVRPLSRARWTCLVRPSRRQVRRVLDKGRLHAAEGHAELPHAAWPLCLAERVHARVEREGRAPRGVS